MDLEGVLNLCRRYAPAAGYHPVLVTAMCQQEASLDETEQRLEPGFYRRYVRPQNFASTTEVLFSTSWGLMQLMGWSLNLLGFFDRKVEGITAFNLQVTHLLDEFMEDPSDQIRYGVCWMKVKELQITGTAHSEAQAGAMVRKMAEDWDRAGWPPAARILAPDGQLMRKILERYNGSAEYPDLLLRRYPILIRSLNRQ